VRDLERILDLAAGASAARAGVTSGKRATGSVEPPRPRQSGEGKARPSKARTGGNRTVKR